MSVVERSFDGVSRAFNEYEATVRGQIRYGLTQDHLQEYIDRGQVKTAIDVCGGSGPDTVWLACQGVEVTLVEPSADQLVLAEKRFARLGSTVRALIKDPIQAVPEALGLQHQNAYDLVLSHGVEMYRADPEAHLRTVFGFAKPGTGILSSLEKGYFASLSRLAEQGKWDEFDALVKTKKFVNNMGFEVTTFTIQEREHTIMTLGASIMATYGVCIDSEKWRVPRSDLSDSAFNSLYSSEKLKSEDSNTRGNAHMLHTIALRKR